MYLLCFFLSSSTCVLTNKKAFNVIQCANTNYYVELLIKSQDQSIFHVECSIVWKSVRGACGLVIRWQDLEIGNGGGALVVQNLSYLTERNHSQSRCNLKNMNGEVTSVN